MTRRDRRPTAEYGRCLPENVFLKWEPHLGQYRLSMDDKPLATVPEKQVLKWKNPERVFASVARRKTRETPA